MIDMNIAIPLSVLDLAPVSDGFLAGDALRNSLDLVRRAEALGFRRYWVAEHHNMPGIASSAPAVLLAHLASVSSTIRLGSGGVMLPNHSPLVVAEQFGMLEALHPGRIDLGLGRAPGTDQLTAHALRRGGGADVEYEFPEQLRQLLGYFDGTLPADHPYHPITAVPARGYRPAMWMLGSSTYGAQAAGQLGWPYSFAHHFASEGTDDAVAAYRRSFRPAEVLDEPYLMLGVSVICADTDEQAAWLARSGLLSFIRLRAGRPGLFPTPEEAAAYVMSPMEQALVRQRTGSQVVGSPATVRDGLQRLIDRTGADELMVTTMVHSHAARIRSFELLAEMTERSPLQGSMIPHDLEELTVREGRQEASA